MSPYSEISDEHVLIYDELVRNAMHMETPRNSIEAHALLLDLYYHYYGLNLLSKQLANPVSTVSCLKGERVVRKALITHFLSEYRSTDVQEILSINFHEYMEVDLETTDVYGSAIEEINKREAEAARRAAEAAAAEAAKVK